MSSKRERIKNRVKDFIRAGDDEELLQDLAKGIEDAIQRFQVFTYRCSQSHVTDFAHKLSSDVTNQVSSLVNSPLLAYLTTYPALDS